VTTRVGILGLGSIGETHARVVTALSPRLELVAYSCGDDRAAELAGRVPGRRESPEELLADPDVDLVVITTPSNQHGEQALAALAHGKGIVVEKPLATTAARAEEVVAAWRASGLFGAVIAQRRFEPQHVAIKRLLDAGELGRPLVGEISVLWWRTPDYYRAASWRREPPGGGVLMNQALHSVDLLTWFLGEATEVAAIDGNLVHDMGAEDTSIAAVRFASGALGSIIASTATRPGMPARLGVHTDRGSFELDHAAITRWDFPGVGRPDAGTPTVSGAGDPSAIGDAGHRQQWLDIADALETGSEPGLTLADGLPAVRLIDAIYRSDATGRRQSVGDYA